MTIVIALIVGLGLVQLTIALSGTFVWFSLAAAVLAVFVAIVVHRRAQEASDLALADAPSFADVLPQ
jgi:membrane protein implicated in regulation of membrane protease activity